MIAPETVAKFIRETAQTRILPRFGALKSGDLREKRPGDPVTIADIETERDLTRLLSDALPGSDVLGEEAAAADPSRFGLVAGEAPVWIVDPIDGTSNFVRGKGGFAVIVALAAGGRTRQGWIYDPLGDRMIWAVEGGGAWFEGKRRTIAPPTPDKQVGSAYGRAASGQHAAKALSESGGVGGVRNFGCCGIEYQEVVLGSLDFSLHSRSLPWDHAAGLLLVAEAGGVAGFLDGAPYDLGVVDRAVLTAGSRAGWERVRDIVARPEAVAVP
jgi:fructose-1,6-bisphosphatase/inositol monophosphatase family enzyme